MSEEKADNLESQALKALDEQIITVEEIKNKIDDIIDVAEKKKKLSIRNQLNANVVGVTFQGIKQDILNHLNIYFILLKIQLVKH